MAYSEDPPPLPPPSTVWIDPRTGRLTREAYDWLVKLAQYLKRLRASIP